MSAPQFFSDEGDLEELLEAGPAVTNVDVTVQWLFYWRGVFYNEAECGSYEEEEVPGECRTGYGAGYTCLGDCKAQ